MGEGRKRYSAISNTRLHNLPFSENLALVTLVEGSNIFMTSHNVEFLYFSFFGNKSWMFITLSYIFYTYLVKSIYSLENTERLLEMDYLKGTFVNFFQTYLQFFYLVFFTY